MLPFITPKMLVAKASSSPKRIRKKLDQEAAKDELALLKSESEEARREIKRRYGDLLREAFSRKQLGRIAQSIYVAVIEIRKYV